MMGNSDSLTGQKILIVTDAWRQVNGVVTTLENLNRCLIDDGYDVDFLNSDDADYACDMPLYPEVKLAWVKDYVIKRKVSWADAVHIATPEGPIGFKTRNYCVKHNIPFTTGYHTKWPEFVRARLPVPQKLTYTLMRWLHKPSCCVLVPTESVRHELESHGMKNLTLWTRGVNRTQFSSRFRERSAHRSVPTLLCVSRVSHEKGLDDFCNLAYNGKKILVGDGPYLEELKRKYPNVEYTGVKTGRELAEYYANADVFVFPSKSDTFGVVMIESMACGTPVAAYPVTGPKDVVDHGVTGILHEDLAQAVEQCVLLNRKTVAQHSKKWSWRKCAQQFVNSLAWIYR